MWEQIRFGKDRGIYGIVEKPKDDKFDGDLIITLPGLGQAMSEKNYMFSNLRKRLAEHHKWVVQFDYRGCGDSFGEFGGTSISSMVSDTLEVLGEVTKERKPECIYFIGNALGAVVAQKAALTWENKTDITCTPILISPPLKKLPHSSELFDKQSAELLKKEGAIDSQRLVPGYDYYTLSDFNMLQYQYFTVLGAHMLYLHGQRISYHLIEELDNLDPLCLFNKNRDSINAIFGMYDVVSINLARQVKGMMIYQLQEVDYYHQHPASMDELIQKINFLISKGLQCTVRAKTRS